MLSVLIVDDEKMTREGLRDSLDWASLGYEAPVLADDGLQASAMLDRFSPDVVLCDVRMPQMDGIQFGSILRKRLPDCKLIFFSGYSEKEYLKAAISLRAEEYMEKPAELDELSRVLREIARKIITERAAQIHTRSAQNENMALLRERLALNLAAPMRVSAGEWMEQAEACKLSLPQNGFYVSIVAQIESMDVFNEHASVHGLIENWFKQAMEKCGHTYISAFKGAEHFIAHVWDNPAMPPARYQSSLASVLAEQPDSIGECISVSIGVRARGPDHVYESYQSAVLGLQRRFFRDSQNVFCAAGAMSGHYVFSDEEAKHFEAALRQRDSAQCIACVEHIAAQMRMLDGTLVSVAKAVFFKLYALLRKAADERNIVLQEQMEDVWGHISETKTLRELTRYLIDKIEAFFSAIHGLDQYGSLVSKIVLCVEENYANSKLSIQWIARRMYLTPTYLCMVFKSRTGKTINQYITETRMANAKRLLRDKSAKLYEIAKRVGYDDPNYFAKIFKKREGMNPSEYRRGYLL